MAETAANIQTRLNAYLAAEERILQGGQESEHSTGADGRRTRRASLQDIREQIKTLQQDLAAAEARESGGGRSVTCAPRW